MKKFLPLFLILILVLSLGFTGCKPPLIPKQKFEFYSFDFFDTVTTIIGFEKDQKTFDKNCKKIEKELLEYHKLYDIYTNYDGITNLCTLNKTQGKPVKVDRKIIDLLTYAKSLNQKTDKLNIAMGSLLSIWHDHREQGINHPELATLPQESLLKEATQHINIDDVIINAQNNTVLIKDSALKLDVGAIAKGYATERVAEYMTKNGISGYLLNVGGNVRIVGKRDDGEKWKVGIENPDSESSDTYIETLSLEDVSLVTSGSYQRFYYVNGKSYNHIIDPATLYPAERFASVSVLCKDSGLADGLSTALFCLSYEDGKKLLEQFPDVSAMWVKHDGKKLYAGNFKEYCIK